MISGKVRLKAGYGLCALLLMAGCHGGHPGPTTAERSGVEQARGAGPQVGIAGQRIDEGAPRAMLEAGRDEELRWPDFSPLKADVAAFYEANGNIPAWTRGRQPTAQAMAYIAMFEHAEDQGLIPEDYDASRWSGRLSGLTSVGGGDAVARLDVAVTVSLMRYVRALNVGRLNPKHPGAEVNVEQGTMSLAALVHDRLENAGDPAGAIRTLEPPWPGYWRTVDVLHRLQKAQKEDGGELLPVPVKPVEPGQAYASVGRLAQFLRRIGDLPADAAVATDTQVYDGSLVDAVKLYQLRHGLAQDGKLSAAVVNDLNTPLRHRIVQAELALERWRWASHAFPEPPVVVNVPEFKVRAYDAGGHAMLTKAVIVGKAYGHKTPLFENAIKYVIFRPYWEVPPSIQREEIVPHIERDREYIAKKNFEVVTASGSAVTSGAIGDEVLAGLRAGRYRVRQKPGERNALGLVKIIFPNPDNVYLHGTDAPHLFALSRRDLSHGCVRVEDPAELVAWVLRNNAGWDVERVKAAMNGTQDNVTVNLARPIPILIVYSTVATDPDGRAYFLSDIYGFDAQLEAALAKGYPYQAQP